MFGSGGMPSSHSATVTALAVAIGFHDGTGGSAFALAVVLAAVVMYDATGVRLYAGRQAEGTGKALEETKDRLVQLQKDFDESKVQAAYALATTQANLRAENLHDREAFEAKNKNLKKVIALLNAS